MSAAASAPVTDTVPKGIDYIAARNARMEINRKRMEAMGIEAEAEKLRSVMKPSPTVRRKRPAHSTPLERRESTRTKSGSVNYAESDIDDFFGTESWSKPSKYARGTASQVPLDEEAARQARIDAGIDVDAAESTDSGKSSNSISQLTNLADTPSRKRGAQDSGKGVRVMAGKVYDSKFGVTCHWCRQKTLTESVTCTAPGCGERRLPVSFCKSCLLNRHGENWAAARDNGCWICPPCRGSCGPGCLSCCNCGPCRKKLNLIPTGQVKSKAAQDGFDNIHDWLVFQATGESAAALAARKEAAPWLSKTLGSAPKGNDHRKTQEAKGQQVVGKKRKRASNGSKAVTTCVDAVHNAIVRGVPPVTLNSAGAGVPIIPSPNQPYRKKLKPRQLHFCSQTQDAVAAAVLDLGIEDGDIIEEDESLASGSAGIDAPGSAGADVSESGGISAQKRGPVVAAIAARVSEDDFDRFVRAVNAKIDLGTQMSAAQSTIHS